MLGKDFLVFFRFYPPLIIIIITLITASLIFDELSRFFSFVGKFLHLLISVQKTEKRTHQDGI